MRKFLENRTLNVNTISNRRKFRNKPFIKYFLVGDEVLIIEADINDTLLISKLDEIVKNESKCILNGDINLDTSRIDGYGVLVNINNIIVL